MSKYRKKCFPKLSRLRKDLWSWHSDVEGLMNDLESPKKNALVKSENAEDKMNSKCFEMIHKLCRLSDLKPEEIAELLKDADSTRPISRFASSGQLSSGRLTQSRENITSRSRTQSRSPERRKPTVEKGSHRYRSPTRRQPQGCLKANWSRSGTSSPEDDVRKNLTFDADDGNLKTSSRKQKGKRSPITGTNTKKVITDLEYQIVELEKENDKLINEVEKLEKEVHWYKNNRDYWIQYCKENDRGGKTFMKPASGGSKAEYDQLRKQYEHLQGVYENICNVLNNTKPPDQQYVQQLQADANRYRTERNNALLQIQEMNDKMNWYKEELQDIREDIGYRGKKEKRRYGKKLF